VLVQAADHGNAPRNEHSNEALVREKSITGT